MKPKKNPKISLERKRLIFFEIGMVVALAAALLAFEWTTALNLENRLEKRLSAEPEFYKDKILSTPRKDKNKEKPRLTLIINEVDDNNFILEEPEFWNPESQGDEGFRLKFIDYIDEPDFVDEDSIFIRVEEMPKFNNGDPEIEFRKYIASKLVFPQEAIENGVDGRVTVTFVIDKQG